MSRSPLFSIAVSLCLLGAGSAFAQERQAVLIANQSYEQLDNVAQASSVIALSQTLRRADFEVSAFSNLDTRGMRRALAGIEDALAQGQQILVVLAGQVHVDDTGVWLLATDAGRPSALMPGDNALSISALADLLSETQNIAVLMIGADNTAAIDAPQGVSVFTGDPSALGRLVRDHLLVEGRTLADVARAATGGITATGYLPTNHAFLPGSSSASALPDGITDADIEALFFAKAQQANTETAYLDFLSRYPNGASADQARRLLADLTRSPSDIARDAERALNLSRNARQEIQSDLTLLGFDTNGVDGIFGRGTRAAINRWQAASDLEVSGYLSADQIALMQQQALNQRQELERQDAAFWRQTGRLGTVDGYRNYLNRYPEGIFADFARDGLSELTAAAEADAWAQARAADTLEAYQSFLSAYPDGINADAAEARIAELTPIGPSEAQINEAKTQEERAVANPIFRLLAEQRLAALGFNPGTIDGRFDANTRAAIAAYQAENDLVPTGYLDIASINKLLNT